jgi:signal transduction histidine kinase
MTFVLSHPDPRIEFPNSASAIDPDIAFIIPLLAGEKKVGVLFLSPKVSRQVFSNDDIFLLQGLVLVTAVALRSAMLVHDVSLRDTFISIASHELRAPLTALRASAIF